MLQVPRYVTYTDRRACVHPSARLPLRFLRLLHSRLHLSWTSWARSHLLTLTYFPLSLWVSVDVVPVSLAHPSIPACSVLCIALSPHLSSPRLPFATIILMYVPCLLRFHPHSVTTRYKDFPISLLRCPPSLFMPLLPHLSLHATTRPSFPPPRANRPCCGSPQMTPSSS